MIKAILLISFGALLISAWCAWQLMGIRAEIARAHVRIVGVLLEAVAASEPEPSVTEPVITDLPGIEHETKVMVIE